MKATLYVFAYTGVSAETHLAVCREARDWPELVHGVVKDDALIERARSKAASHFLIDKDAGDVMLMVDHDISWQHGDLRYLAEKCAETGGIVAGLYSKRSFENRGMTFRIDEPTTFTTGEDRLIPATYVSTGFVAIHREVVEYVARDMQPVVQGFYPMFLPMVVDTQHGHEHLSEDWAFCERAKAMPIHAAAKPRLLHEGQFKYRMQDSLTEIPAQHDVEITHNSAKVLVA